MDIELTQQTMIMIAIAAILGLIVGYLIAAIGFGRRNTELETHSNGLNQQLEQTIGVKEALQSRFHELEIEFGKLTERAKNLEATETRLLTEINHHQSSKDEWDYRQRELTESLQQAEKNLEASRTEGRAQRMQIDELQSRIEDEKASLAQATEEYKTLTAKHQSTSSDYIELKTTLEKREEHFAQQLKQLEDSKSVLGKEFENIANKIFEEKGKTFSQTSSQSIQGMLKPFSDKIESFQKRVNDIHESSIKDTANLGAEIKKVLDIGLKMSAEANNLTSALKGDSQQRGAWGEAQLQRTLEMSGLVEDAHFESQTSFKDAEGKIKRTDYLIKLPDGKQIIIDSKVSLVDYDKAVSADTPESQQLAMNDHVKAVKTHIDELASKDYTNLIGMRSPSFVLMFMPIEAAYIEALKQQKDLFEYGYKKNIVLVSHTTLIPILRTVSNLWMMERSNKEAREISDKAADIFNQVCVVAERLNKLGGTLGTLGNQYNDTVTAMAGNRGLYGKVERFGKLSAKASKSLPKLEAAHRDIDTERLTLIVEAVEDDASEVPAAVEKENLAESEQVHNE